MKYTKTLDEKKLELISQIYNLSEKETKYLEYYLLCKINDKISDLDDHVKDYSKMSKILKTKHWVCDSIYEGLKEKGLLVSHSDYDINSKILQIFERNEIKTAKQIKQIVLGTTQKSNLKWSDYEYLNSEKDIVLSILKSAVNNKTKGINILLYGDVGTGKTQFAKLVSNIAKVELYEVDYSTNSKNEASRQDRLTDLFSKQQILSLSDNSCLLFDEAEDVMNNSLFSSKAYFNKILEDTPIPILWTTNNIYDVDPAFLRRMTYTIRFEKLSENLRLNIWNNILKKNKFKVDKNKIIELNKLYEVSPSIISNAVQTTKLINGTQDDFEMFIKNVSQLVCKKKNTKKQKGFEMSEYNDNLVNANIDIKDLTLNIKKSNKLNFSLCLYGEPGTGKSLYARYLASELGLNVILKRASDLISPYVGQTEKNISEAFAEARGQGAMLIIDEADTFLQNRNNAVRSWEVSQVNEMLTWMESHEYPFVCTTNLLDTLDEASLRRFTFKIKFDFLNKEQVHAAFVHFFNITNSFIDIKGLTAGDFTTVKKKVDFLNILDEDKIIQMLKDEVKLKQSKELKHSIGF